MNRWNMSFYFSFRFQDITTRVDDATKKPIEVKDEFIALVLIF
jgi:hypothetical protein